MIRANVLFSVVLVSLMTSACQKESKRPVQQQQRPLPGQPMLRPGTPGAPGGTTDTSLNANNSTTVPTQNVARAQRSDISDDSQSQSTVPAPSSADQGPVNSSPTTNSRVSAPSARENSQSEAPSLSPSTAAQTPQTANPSAANNATPEAVAAPPATTAATPGSSSSAQTPQDPALTQQAANGDSTNGQTPAALSVFPTGDSQPAGSVTVTSAIATNTDFLSSTLTPPVHVDDPKWIPGLPRDPAPKAQLINGALPNGALFTDSSGDELMAAALLAYNAEPSIVTANDQLAKTINHVHLISADGKNYWLYMDVAENNNVAHLVFQGTRLTNGEVQALQDKKANAKNKKGKPVASKVVARPDALARSFELVQDKSTTSDAPLTYRYRMHVRCSDEALETCANAMIHLGRFNLHPKKGDQPNAKAEIVYRLGPAIVTFVDPLTVNIDDAAKPPTESVRNFVQFLMDTHYNVCLLEKTTATGDLLNQLESKCPGNNPNTGASNVMMRTWAVAGGGAKYDVIFANGADKNDVYFSKSLVFNGDLVVPNEGSTEHVFVTDRAKAGRESWVKAVELVSNDGAGALNFKLSFPDSDETVRISVTSNFSKTRAPELKSPKPTATSDAGAPHNTKKTRRS